MVGSSSWWGRGAVDSVSVYQAESEHPHPEWKTSGPRAGGQSPKAGGVVCDVLCGRQDCVLSDGTPRVGVTRCGFPASQHLRGPASPWQ